MGTLREQFLILISTPIYVIVIGLEMVFSHFKHRHSYTRRDTFSNVYLMLLNMGIDLLFRAVYLIALDYCFQHRWIDAGTGVVYWLALVIAEDFVYYWLHRIDHQSRFFWAVHVTHHSSEKFNLSVGFRSSVFQPLYRFLYFIPLALVGFKPLDILFVFSATQIWGILVHTEYVGKMGFLEYFLVTPSHHRVHHASNPLYLDRNLGMFLIIWDKLFGTFQPELEPDRYEPIRYGLTKPIPTVNAWTIVFHEWTNILRDLAKPAGWRNKLRYLFGPPGWSHDGSTHTSDQMRAQERVQRKAGDSVL